MTTSNPNLDRLKAMSETMAKILEAVWDFLFIDEEDDVKEKIPKEIDLDLLRQYLVRFEDLDGVEFEDLYTIAADLLRLADRVEELEDFCENEVLAVKGVQMDYKKGKELYERLKIKDQTPASAGGGKE